MRHERLSMEHLVRMDITFGPGGRSPTYPCETKLKHQVDFLPHNGVITLQEKGTHSGVNCLNLTQNGVQKIPN